MSQQFLSIKELCFISVFVAMIIGVSLLPPIPLLGGVPITLQTFIIPLAGAVLGAKKGGLAALVYVLIGAIGLPVFSGFTGGIGRIFGVTGGFILSFPLMAFVIGAGADKNNKIWLALALVAGYFINLFVGMVQFAFVAGVGLQQAFMIAVAPFIVIEVAKMIVVFIVSLSVRKILTKSGLSVI